jgi:hypothetical protein
MGWDVSQTLYLIGMLRSRKTIPKGIKVSARDDRSSDCAASSGVSQSGFLNGKAAPSASPGIALWEIRMRAGTVDIEGGDAEHVGTPGARALVLELVECLPAWVVIAVEGTDGDDGEMRGDAR